MERNKQRHYPAKSICHFLDRDMEAVVLYFWRLQGRRRAIAITSFIQAPFACTFPYVHSRGGWLWKVKVLLGIGYSPLLSTVTIYNSLERKCESGFLCKYGIHNICHNQHTNTHTQTHTNTQTWYSQYLPPSTATLRSLSKRSLALGPPQSDNQSTIIPTITLCLRWVIGC